MNHAFLLPVLYLAFAMFAAEAQTIGDQAAAHEPSADETLFLDCTEGLEIAAPRNEACETLLRSDSFGKPTTSEGFRRIGAVFEALGRHEQALAAAERAIALNEDNAAAYSLRGWVRYREGGNAEATADFERALSLDSADVSANHGLGTIHVAQGNYEKAAPYFDVVALKRPRSASAHVNRGLANAHLNRYEEAIADFTMAASVNPTEWQAFHFRGLAHVELGHFEQALEDYDRAARIAPNLADIHNAKAWLLATAPIEQVRNGAMAVAEARLAVRLESGNANFHDTLAAAHAENGDFTSAAEAQRAAIELWRAEGAAEEIAGAEQRLALYMDGEPYRDVD